VFRRISEIRDPKTSNKFPPEPPPSSVEILLMQTLELNLTMLKLLRSSFEEMVEQESVSLSEDFFKETISVFFTFFFGGDRFSAVSTSNRTSTGESSLVGKGGSDSGL
jgi:hypothetical protein